MSPQSNYDVLRNLPHQDELTQRIERATVILRRDRKDHTSWLAALISPVRIANLRTQPAYKNFSTAYLIYLDLSRILLTPTELPNITRTRLRSLVGTFRLVAYPSLTHEEQALFPGRQIDISSLDELDPDVAADISYLQQTFELSSPKPPVKP